MSTVPSKSPVTAFSRATSVTRVSCGKGLYVLSARYVIGTIAEVAPGSSTSGTPRTGCSKLAESVNCTHTLARRFTSPSTRVGTFTVRSPLSSSAATTSPTLNRGRWIGSVGIERPGAEVAATLARGECARYRGACAAGRIEQLLRATDGVHERRRPPDGSRLHGRPIEERKRSAVARDGEVVARRPCATGHRSSRRVRHLRGANTSPHEGRPGFAPSGSATGRSDFGTVANAFSRRSGTRGPDRRWRRARTRNADGRLTRRAVPSLNGPGRMRP
jgi:hypothetical protein